MPAAPRKRDVSVPGLAAAWEAQATGCRFTRGENLQPISVPFTSTRNMLEYTTIYSFQNGSMSTKTQSQPIFFPSFSATALPEQGYTATSCRHPRVPLALCSPPSERPVPHHRYLLHNPKYLQGCFSNIALICYPLHSPPGQFLLACFLSLGLRFRQTHYSYSIQQRPSEELHFAYVLNLAKVTLGKTPVTSSTKHL